MYSVRVCVYSACARVCLPHLTVLVLVGVRVHKDAEASEEVQVSEHGACREGSERCRICPHPRGPQLIVPPTTWVVLPTDLHALLGQPEGQAVTMEVLLALPVDFKLHLELPVL